MGIREALIANLGADRAAEINQTFHDCKANNQGKKGKMWQCVRQTLGREGIREMKEAIKDVEWECPERPERPEKPEKEEEEEAAEEVEEAEEGIDAAPSSTEPSKRQFRPTCGRLRPCGRLGSRQRPRPDG